MSMLRRLRVGKVCMLDEDTTICEERARRGIWLGNAGMAETSVQGYLSA